MSTTHIVIHGASGKMGRRIIALCERDDSIALRGAIVREGSSALARPGFENTVFSTWKTVDFRGLERAVVVDFSTPAALLSVIDATAALGAALLVGTTGLSSSDVEKLRASAKERAVLLAPNTSRGVAVCCDVVARMARLLGPTYRCAIVEAHHDQKKDAPSGTALRLASAARAGHAVLADDQILSMRGGDVIGEHTVRFAGAGEYIEITHRATTRDLFAQGAINAAKWLAGQPAGWYTIEDVIGLKNV